MFVHLQMMERLQEVSIARTASVYMCLNLLLYSGLSTSVSVIMAIILFVIGVFGGFTSGALVVYGCFKWKLSHQSKHPPPPIQPTPTCCTL